MAAVFLQAVYGEAMGELDLTFMGRLDRSAWRLLSRATERGLNAPPTSSAGRLFDAVASLLGLRDRVDFDGASDSPLGSFLPGVGVGGAGAHWNGVTWRLLPTDHNLRTHLENRYGKNAVPAAMTIEDFPVSYDELEPYYDRFEKLLGISGKAGNLRGQKIDGGNVSRGRARTNTPISRWR